MGAKVGNIGGGMVELLNLNINYSSGTNLTHNFTDEEDTKIKEWCDIFDFFVFAGYIVGANGALYNDEWLKCKELKRFISGPTSGNRNILKPVQDRDFWFTVSGGKCYSTELNLSGTAPTTPTEYALKIYGIKL